MKDYCPACAKEVEYSGPNSTCTICGRTKSAAELTVRSRAAQVREANMKWVWIGLGIVGAITLVMIAVSVGMSERMYITVISTLVQVVLLGGGGWLLIKLNNKMKNRRKNDGDECLRMSSMSWKWKEIGLPALNTLRSTGQLQPIEREQCPSWTRDNPKFSAAWITPMEGTVAQTRNLSNSNVIAKVDYERISTSGAPFRYYRYFSAEMADGRVFQAGPFKNLEYERHRNERPPWLKAYTTESSC